MSEDDRAAQNAPIEQLAPGQPAIFTDFQPKSLVTSQAPEPGRAAELQPPPAIPDAQPAPATPETLGMDFGVALSQLATEEHEELEYAKQHVAHALGWLAAYRSKQAQIAAAERGTPPAAPGESGEQTEAQSGGEPLQNAPPPSPPASGRSRRAAANGDA